MPYKLDRTSVEEIGINVLDRTLLYSKTLVPILTKREKHPIWDGNILLYKEGKKNENKFLIDKIPVQVKAKTNKNIPTKNYSHSIAVDELRIFQRSSGIAYFVIYVHNTNPEKCKIFYSFLTPVDLVRHIASAGKQKSITIKMEEFPTLNQQVENSFLDFYYDCKRQTNFSSPIFLEDIEHNVESYKIMFSYDSDADRNDLFKYITTHENFVYVTFKGDPTKTPHPLGDRRYKFKAFQEVEINISVNGKVYFNKCVVEIENGEMFIVVENVIRFPFPMELSCKLFNGRINIDTKFQTLAQQIKVLEFLIEVIKTKSFCVGEIKMNISNIGQNDLTEFKANLERSNNLSKVLTELHIKEDLELSNLSDKEIQNINSLIRRFLFNKNDKLPNLTPPRFAKMDIGNISVLFFADKESDDKIRLTPAFDLSLFAFYTIDNKEKKIEIPPYAAYDSEIFRDACNINYSDILPAFKALQSNNDKFYQLMNRTILRMLMGYDLQNKKKEIILETALEMAIWLEENDPDQSSHDIHTINRLQIKKRMNLFNEEDSCVLYAYLGMKDSCDELKFAAHLLLGNQNEAKIYFGKLDESTKELYRKELPLYNLIN